MPICDGNDCCHKSTIRNISGETRTFAFLPGHSHKSLADGEERSFNGDVRETISRRSKRGFTAMVNAIEDGRMDILRTPNPIVYDHTADEPRMLKLAGGTVTWVDPCWANNVDSL